MKLFLIPALSLVLASSASAGKVNLDTLNQSECGESATVLGIDLSKLVRNCLTPMNSPYASQRDAWSLLIWYRNHANLDGAGGGAWYLLTKEIADQLEADPIQLLRFTKTLSEKDLARFPFNLSRIIDLEKLTPEERAELRKTSPHLIKRLQKEAKNK